MRVVQLNLAVSNDRIAPWPDRLVHIRSLLVENGVDVVIAQAGSAAAAEAIVVACPALRYADRHEGLLILSARPMADRQVIALSRQSGTDDPFDRALLAVSIDAIRFVNAHMSWVAEQAADNAREMLAYLDGVEGDVLLAGDFNQEPSSAAIQSFARAGLVDCWARACHGQPGYTYPANAPSARIDYMLMRSATLRVGGMRVVGATPRLSDHLGIVADIGA